MGLDQLAFIPAVKSLLADARGDGHARGVTRLGRGGQGTAARYNQHPSQPIPEIPLPLTPRQARWLPLLVAGLATVGPFTIDTYLPSFPAIADDLGASEWMVQQTLTAYLIPFAFMMLFHGALSDAFGRKPIILIGVGGYVLASVGCALATNMTMLLVCRALQGLVAGDTFV